jgi:hypothetical protein
MEKIGDVTMQLLKARRVEMKVNSMNPGSTDLEAVIAHNY